MPGAPDATDPTAPDAASGAPAAAPPSQIDRAIDRFLRHLAVERGRSINTLSAYRRDLAAYRAVLAERGVTEPRAIGVPDVAAFQAAVAPGRAVASLARMTSTVRGFHRFLLDEGLVEVDATDGAAAPKLPARLPKAITIAQMERLLEASGGGAGRDDAVGLRDRALLELLYATGARISEAVALDVDDAVGDDGEAAPFLRLFGKGNKQRIVPVGSHARAALDAWLVRGRPALVGRATPALFLGQRGARFSRQHAWLVIRAAAERAELDVELSPHTFRHSFATHLLQGGADVRVVQELLGHASVATTQIYTLVTADTLRDMYTTAHPRAR